MVKRQEDHYNIIFIDRLYLTHCCDAGCDVALSQLSCLGISTCSRSKQDDVYRMLVDHFEFTSVLLNKRCVFRKSVLSKIRHRDECFSNDSVHRDDLLKVHFQAFIIYDGICLAFFERVDDLILRQTLVQRNDNTDIHYDSVVCDHPRIRVRSDDHDPLAFESLAQEICSDTVDILSELVEADLRLGLSVLALVDESSLVSIMVIHEIQDLLDVLEFDIILTFILSHKFLLPLQYSQ